MSNRPPGFDIRTPFPEPSDLPPRSDVGHRPKVDPEREVTDGGGGGFVLFLLISFLAFLTWLFY